MRWKAVCCADLRRQALQIPPATLFAFQVLLGVVFGLWGIHPLALPLMAVVNVMIDHFKAGDETPAATRLPDRRALRSARRGQYRLRYVRPLAARQNTARPARATP